MNPSLIEQERKDRALLEGMDSRYFGSSTCLTIYAAGVSFAVERDLNPVMKMAVPAPEKARVNGARGGAVRRKQAAIKSASCAVMPRKAPQPFPRPGDPRCTHSRTASKGNPHGKKREQCLDCGISRFSEPNCRAQAEERNRAKLDKKSRFRSVVKATVAKCKHVQEHKNGRAKGKQRWRCSACFRYRTEE